MLAISLCLFVTPSALSCTPHFCPLTFGMLPHVTAAQSTTVQMRFDVGSTATWLANNYTGIFLAAANSVFTASSNQSYIVASTIFSGSLYFTAAIIPLVTSPSAAYLPSNIGAKLRLAFLDRVGSTNESFALYTALNSSSLGNLTDLSFSPVVKQTQSLTQCPDGAYMEKCTPCGLPQCIRTYPSSGADAVLPSLAMGVAFVASVAFLTLSL